MDLGAMQVFTSLLAIGAAALAISIMLGAVLRSSVGWVDLVMSALEDAALWIACIIAAAAMSGSLYFSESAHLEPCRLCWFQRIAMYPLAAILLVAALRKDRAVAWYVVPVAAIGACIALYHYVIEWRPELEAGSCEFGPSCTDFYFREFGFVTLAFMALCGFAAIIALTTLAALARPAGHAAELNGSEERPER